MNNQRVIKFRVWDPEELCWRDGCRIDQKGLVQSSWGKDKHDWIVQQFTGLQDRNGRDIYEGDIIQAEFVFDKKKHRYKQVIEFGELGAGDDADLDSYGYHINPYWYGKYEVIGNILEHPHLAHKTI